MAVKSRTKWVLVALSLLLLAGVATAATGKTKGLRYPSLTPDGKDVVFCYRGDVWIAAVDGKSPARRLTLHEEQDTLPRVSPDGKWIVFSSRRNGSYDLYLLPTAGGVPKQITFHSNFEIVCDWSPDGKKVLFTSQKEVGWQGGDLYEVGIAGGTPRRVTRDGAREGSYSPDGRRILYVRGFNTIYWDNYEGSANFDIYAIDLTGGSPVKLTDTRGNERWPFFSEDLKSVYFVTEEKGVANFYSMPAAGGERKQLTKYKGADVHRPDLGWDGKTVVFELEGKLYFTDLTKPAEKPTHIPLTIQSDIRNSGVERRTITSGCEQVDVSPDGSQVAFTVRGDVWVMPASGGTGKQVTTSPANEQWPKFSPDGRQIAFFSSATGNSDIFIQDLATGNIRRVTTHSANDFFHAWSPDGRKLVFTSERSGNRDIWSIDLETKFLTQLTKHPAPDDDPRWSPDGKLIAFDSGRAGSQDIYVMNADGSNLRRVTQGAGFFQVPVFSPDGKMLVFESFIPTTGQSGGLFLMQVSGGPSVRLSPDGATACWTPDGEHIYFHATRGPGGSGVFRMRAPKHVEVGEPVPFIGTMEVDRRTELANLFDEAWNALRESFYDAKMHGVDWNKMRTKYRDMAIDSEHKDEFQNVVRQMLAELDASHLGIGGGDRLGFSVMPAVKENGYLGAEFAHETAEGGGRRVLSIVPGGPAEQAGMRVGDVVTRIGRMKLTAKTNLDKATAGTRGQTTPVFYRPLSASGLGPERTAAVTPISAQELYNLRFAAWEKSCITRVRESTKGRKDRVGYVHLQMMNGQNLQKFQQAVMRFNSDRKNAGMILDVRFNGGGNIHNQLMSVLWAKPLARVQVRGGPKGLQPTLHWDKPVVLLINERSFSDAEVFPFMFKTAGIGPVVGVPTAGGVIGTNDISLSDGSNFRVPRTGFWSLKGKDLEGLGIEPDILVVETPEDRAAGRDPQLAKALEVLFDLIDKRKAAKPEKPTKPVKPVKPVDAKPPTPAPEKPAQPVKADAMHPLADARVGEWVRYRLTNPQAKSQAILKVTVTKVEGGIAFFEKEYEEGAMPLPLPDQAPVTGSVLENLEVLGKIGTHSVVSGRIRDVPVEILMVRMAGPGAMGLDLKFSNLIPAYGLYKVESGKFTVVEAIDWGQPEAPAEAPEKPVEPVKPVEPAKPEKPVAPEKPVEPVKPETPVEPAPVKPETPDETEAPSAPPHPVFDAEVGEWVKVRRFAPNGRSLEMLITVKEVTDDEVILEQVALVGERRMQGPDVRRSRDETLVPPDGFELQGYAQEEVTVGDGTFKCWVMTATASDGSEWKWFVANEVPVNGYVKILKDGEPVLEIIEWGKE